MHANNLCITSGPVTLSGDKRQSPEDVIQVLEEKLTRADETIRDQEQQIQAMGKQVIYCAVICSGLSYPCSCDLCLRSSPQYRRLLS